MSVKQLKALQKYGKPMRLAGMGWDSEWQILITILLSARTRDEVTIEVAEKLYDTYPTLEALSKASQSQLERAIKSINFFSNKARYVKACAHDLITRYNGKVPHDLDELVTLPGVGRKTAGVFLAELGYQAIGVDTHVLRIAKKLGWTTHTNPDKVCDDLLEYFPRKYWKEVNTTLVLFGKSHTKREEDVILEKIKLIR